MRITVVMGFFLPVPAAAGGATEKSWEGLAREFAAAGHDVTVISRRWRDWPEQAVTDGVRHLRLAGFDHTARLPHNLWRDFRWSLRVSRALPPADVTVVNCIALPVWLGPFRGRAGRLAVMTGRAPKGQYRLYRRLDLALAVSSAVRSQVLHENPRLAPLTRVTGYPIAWQALAGPPRSPHSAAPVTLGFVGRLHREKGLSLLVEALRCLHARPGIPTWRVVICGPADIARGGSGSAYRDELSGALTSFLPPDRVDLREPVFDAAALAKVYREIDVFCYPSLAEQGETFGVAVAEAMASGAVPVVSSLPCFGDFVEAGETGEAFDHRTAEAADRLAAILAGLLTDPARRARLAQAAQQRVRHYDFPAYADRLLADFSALL